ncbi:MAG TPA: PaaI family thioesterase [Pseudonocardia sp.]
MDAAEIQRALDASPFGPWWGFAVDSVVPGRARVRLPARPELFRPGGVLQGGCAMTLADVAFWSAIMASVDDGHAAVTLEQTSAFLGAARTDLVCDAELLRCGRSIVYGTADVRDVEERRITHHTLTYMRPTS